MEEILTKEQFLQEHNKLSPANLRVTFAILTKFQEEKKPLLKDTQWSNKLRIPLISWMLATPQKKVRGLGKIKETKYKNYPETHVV